MAAERQKALDNNKSTEVNIVASKTPAFTPPPAPKKEANMVKGKMYSRTRASTAWFFGQTGSYVSEEEKGYDYFILNGDTVSKGQYKVCMGVQIDAEEGDSHDFPENLGVVILKKRQNYTNRNDAFSGWYPIADFVNEKAERVLNDDDVCMIVHFYGDWFMVARRGFEKYIYGYSIRDVELFNFRTKEKLPFKKHGPNNWNVRDVIFDVIYNKIPRSYEKFYRRSPGQFKAAMHARYGNNTMIVYYMNNDGTIESEVVPDR